MSWIWDAKQRNQAPNQAIEIWLDRDGHKKERLFDPYTGQDLGESRPYSIQFIAWLVDLHVNLLAGERGRLINGVVPIFVLLLSFTGAVLWWPGIDTLASRPGHSNHIELEAPQLGTAQCDRFLDASRRVHVRIRRFLRRLSEAVSGHRE